MCRSMSVTALCIPECFSDVKHTPRRVTQVFSFHFLSTPLCASDSIPRFTDSPLSNKQALRLFTINMSIRIRENDLQVILDLLQHADHFLQCILLVFQKLRLTLLFFSLPPACYRNSRPSTTPPASANRTCSTRCTPWISEPANPFCPLTEPSNIEIDF